MRLLSAALVLEKNQLESSRVWTMAFAIVIQGAPGVFRLVNYDQNIIYQGLVYERFPVDVDSLEEPTSAALVHLRLTIGNVTQEMSSLLENYWAAVADPHWEVTIWTIDVTQPDQTPFGTGEVFSVSSVATDLFSAVVDVESEGYTLGKTVPGRRFTTSSGFPYIPRR